MTTCAFLSFRLGQTDGVSVVAETWRRAFEELGFQTITVAGDGPVDRPVPGLQIEATRPPDDADLAKALADADLVVAENILSLPLNLPASRAIAAELAGRPAVLHHHDPPWQRERFAHITELPPADPAWLHVSINQFTANELAARGFAATPIYNGFDVDLPPGDRAASRAALGIADDELLVLHPVRAIARKNIPGAIELAETLGGTYWLPGPAEEGYEQELDRLIAEAECPTTRAPVGSLGRTASMSDAYAACDLVAFPSLWEGFGNPPIEAAIHLRPVAVGAYPVADELRALGFEWLDASDPLAVAAAVPRPDVKALEANRSLVAEHLSLAAMTDKIGRLLADGGLLP